MTVFKYIYQHALCFTLEKLFVFPLFFCFALFWFILVWVCVGLIWLVGFDLVGWVGLGLAWSGSVGFVGFVLF